MKEYTPYQIHYVTGVLFEFNKKKKSRTVEEYSKYYKTVEECLSKLGHERFIEHCQIVLTGIRFPSYNQVFSNHLNK